MGDWLLYKGKRVRIDYAVGRDCVLYYKYDEILSAKYDELMPIPISQNLLLRIGFEECGFHEMRLDTSTVLLKAYIKLGRIELLFNRNIQCSPRVAHEYTVVVPCKYIHELQHIMKDCNIKFTCDLS